MSETPEQAAIWDSATVGTPYPPRGSGHQPCALDENGVPVALGPGGFLCTRQRGHTGQHVATSAREVVAVWPGEIP